jgi:lipopolysaccharide heptosyltransferase II
LKILILKPSSLGDVIQALPVLRLLKRHFPESKIYWWIDANLRCLVENDPDLSGIFVFERKRWASPVHWNEMFSCLRRMRAMRFDWVIDLQSLARSGLFAWLSNGGMTVGLDDPREGAPGFYDLAVPRPKLHAHAVDWYVETLRRLNVPVHWDFIWLPERKDAAAAVQEKWKAGSAGWLLLQPGARWANKRWPTEFYAELVRRLAANHSELRFAILGGAEDAPVAESIARSEPKRCLNLAGQTSLSEMIEWVRLSAILVTNDTGPMHVAAALGRPVVALFGPTSPNRTGPYHQIDSVVQHTALSCVPCLKDICVHHPPMECLRSISPSAVCAEVQRRLG